MVCIRLIKMRHHGFGRFCPLLAALSLLFLGACASTQVVVDTDHGVSLTSVNAFSVIYVSPEGSTRESHLVAQVAHFIKQQNKTVDLLGKSMFEFEISALTQEKPNSKRISIGFGSGTYGRSGGVGVSTGINVPLGPENLPYAVVYLRLLKDKSLIWSASNSVEIDASDPNGLVKAQGKAMEGLLALLPISRQ